MSMMCHEVKVMRKGDTFRMNVANTKPYNADFDGDKPLRHYAVKHLSCPQQVAASKVANNTLEGKRCNIGLFYE